MQKEFVRRVRYAPSLIRESKREEKKGQGEGVRKRIKSTPSNSKRRAAEKKSKSKDSKISNDATSQ
jgi:hypothetical protein